MWIFDAILLTQCPLIESIKSYERHSFYFHQKLCISTNKQPKHVLNRKYFNSNAKKSILSIKLMSRQTFSDEIHLKHSAKLEATEKKIIYDGLYERKKKEFKKGYEI